MANIDKNFIATPSFVVKSEGNGNTVTMQLLATGSTTDSTFTQTGWGKVAFNAYGLNLAMTGDSAASPYNVTPSVSNSDELGSNGDRYARVYNFLEFVHENPVHVKALNLRTTNEVVLPQQIIVKTPNIFTGQMDRQIIDVASKKTAYQYQNGIITINDVDLYLTRNSIIEFSGAFSLVGNADTGASPLYVDIVIDTYLSLEKGLVENVTLLNTVSGQVVAAVEAEENYNAYVNPDTVTLAAQQRVNEMGVQNAQNVSNLTAAQWLQAKQRR